MGTSSVTTYVESGAGVSEGARTGLASPFTAGLFLLAILFVPLMALVGQQVPSARTRSSTRRSRPRSSWSAP